VAEPTLDEYAVSVRTLLRHAAETMSDEDVAAVRTIVHECRAGRGRRTTASASVYASADEIVELLGRAARHLRPRETQQLDDLVAGKVPKPDVTLRHPIRSHRSGQLTR
jgi:hypothetical protein